MIVSTTPVLCSLCSADSRDRFRLFTKQHGPMLVVICDMCIHSASAQLCEERAKEALQSIERNAMLEEAS